MVVWVCVLACWPAAGDLAVLWRLPAPGWLAPRELVTGWGVGWLVVWVCVLACWAAAACCLAGALYFLSLRRSEGSQDLVLVGLEGWLADWVGGCW